MLQAMAEQNVLLYVVAAVGALGVMSQIVLRFLYGRLSKDMGARDKAKGKFTKQLIKGYEEHAKNGERMVNVRAYINKSLMEYHCLGLDLHQWRRFGVIAMGICAALGVGSYFLFRWKGLVQDMQNWYLWTGAAWAAAVAGVYALMDIGYKKTYLQEGLLHLLENTNLADQAEKEPEERTAPVQMHKGFEKTSSISKKKGQEETKAQRDKRELKKNLTRLKEGMSETAAATVGEKERNTEILKQMDSQEQERVIREVLKEFLS